MKIMHIEFCGDNEKDRENYKRYCGEAEFKPLSPSDEVIKFVEYTAFEELERKIAEKDAEIMRIRQNFDTFLRSIDIAPELLVEGLSVITPATKGEKKFYLSMFNKYRDDRDAYLKQLTAENKELQYQLKRTELALEKVKEQRNYHLSQNTEDDEQFKRLVDHEDKAITAILTGDIE